MTLRSMFLLALASTTPTLYGWAQAPASQPVVLVELFTSEGCSSCPPADALLARLNGQPLPGGLHVFGLSEHVTYWNNLGWTDPYSAQIWTQRQDSYGRRFSLDSVYTPQAVVSGDAQAVGSDASAIGAAIAQAAAAQPVHLLIGSATVAGHTLTLHYAANAANWRTPLNLVALVVDDQDRSYVLRGENSGRQLYHVNVARALLPIARLDHNADKTVHLALPEAATASAGGHRLLLFAQEDQAGRVLGAAAAPLAAAR